MQLYEPHSNPSKLFDGGENMTQEKQNEIIECVKYLCDNNRYDVDFDEIEIRFAYTRRPVYRNQVAIYDCVEIVNKQDRYIFAVDCVTTNSRAISKFLLDGYIEEKEYYIRKQTEAKMNAEYKKKHPFLSIFKI